MNTELDSLQTITDSESVELEPVLLESQDTDTHCLQAIRKHFSNIVSTLIDKIKSLFNYDNTTDTVQPDTTSLEADINSDLHEQLLTITVALNKAVHLNQPVQLHKTVATV